LDADRKLPLCGRWKKLLVGENLLATRDNIFNASGLPVIRMLLQHSFSKAISMSTDDARLSLRPRLSLAPATAPDERFQNDTLRPVLKLQHDLLLAVFRLYLAKRKVKLDQIPAKERFARIKELLTRDNRLRGLLFGIAVGQFTASEMNYYLVSEGNVNRRITNLLVERMTSVFAPVER